MRVLLAVLAPRGTATVGFAISLLQLQNALQSAPNMTVIVEVLPSLQEAVKLSASAPSDEAFDAVVAIASHVSFPSAFVLRALVAPAQFVTAIHPLPAIDWKRVAAKAGDKVEAMRFKGNVYNVDPAACKPAPDAPGYVVVPSAELGAVVLKGEAISAVAACGGGSKSVCEAWGRDIYADLEAQCAVTGSVEFTGCVGTRTVIR